MPQYQSDPRSNAPAPIERVNIPAEIEALKNDPAAKESFTLSRKIPLQHFAEYVEAFRIDIAGRGETYLNVKKFRAHFFNWCGCRYEQSQKKAAKHTGNNRSHINNAGGDLSKYLEPQKF